MQSRVHVLHGDITTIAVDVIVNAANPSLLGGGGVDGAIHRVAGPALLAACKQVIQQQGECPTGHAVITLAGAPAKAVIHRGPVWQGGDHHEAERLEEAYFNSLQLALANGYQSIAFPAISTGAYGYPRAAAAEIAVKTVLKFITRRTLPDQIYFVCFDEENARLYKRLLTRKAMNARTDMTRLERAITPLCENHRENAAF
jgi:O-acetyl-ADP-ribose deacetylase (regulator of RNase III)